MSAGQWLMLATCGLGLYSTGQVWLVQLSSYPLWTYVAEREFHAYHAAWWHSIWAPLLGPAALLMICAALSLWWRAPGVPLWTVWAGFALQGALLLGTVFWWAPLMAHIERADGGLSPERYQLLMSTHWVRVGIVSAYAALVLWMLARSAWRV